jgi:hypothetical protein
MADTKAKLTLGGDNAIELDVLKGTLGKSRSVERINKALGYIAERESQQ